MNRTNKDYFVEWIKFFSISTILCILSGGAVNYAAGFLMESFLVLEDTNMTVQYIIWALAYAFSSFIAFRMVLSSIKPLRASFSEIKIDLEAETQAYE